MISKMDKPVGRLLKEKKRKKWNTNVGNKKGDIATDLIDIKRLIKEYCEQLYAHKLDNLGKMDQFLKIKNLSKLTQEEIVQIGLYLLKKLDQ